MLTHIVLPALYAVVAASVVFQVATAARLAWQRNARRPVAIPAALPHRTRRFRQREYRLALRAAKASVAGNS